MDLVEGWESTVVEEAVAFVLESERGLNVRPRIECGTVAESEFIRGAMLARKIRFRERVDLDRKGAVVVATGERDNVSFGEEVVDVVVVATLPAQGACVALEMSRARRLRRSPSCSGRAAHATRRRWF